MNENHYDHDADERIAERDNIDRLLKERGKFVWVTHGRSMSPLLKTKRDIVEITRIDLVYPDCKLKKNDVAMYHLSFAKKRSGYLLHRVHEVHDGYYTIIGDHNTFKEKVPFDWIDGVMTGLTRKGKEVDLNGFCYKAYVKLWGEHFKRRIVVIRITEFFSRPIKAAYHALRKKRRK